MSWPLTSHLIEFILCLECRKNKCILLKLFDMVQHGFGTLLKTIKSWTKTFENKFPQQTFWVKVKKKLNEKKKKEFLQLQNPQIYIKKFANYIRLIFQLTFMYLMILHFRLDKTIERNRTPENFGCLLWLYTGMQVFIQGLHL